VITRVKRWVIEGEDWLRYHPAVRRGMSRCRLLGDAVARPRTTQDLARSVRGLCAAARLAADHAAARAIRERIRRRVAQLDPAEVDWSEFIPDVDDRRVARAAVLKGAVGEREKGVLFIAFESEWMKLLRHCDLRELAARYTLVLAPSSSPDNLANYVFPAAFPAPVFTLISNESDREAIPQISANYVIVPLYASSWVNPELYQPRPRAERDVDVVMVANFAKVKRHHALFPAIRRMPPSVRVLLIGQDQDSRTAESIRAEARCYGVEGRFDVVSNAPYQAVVDALCRSRVSVVLSRREGSCVVVAESLFADTPVALLESAVIGSRAFINPVTGRFLKGDDLAGQLMDFLASDGYAPRRWAEQHISCQASTQVLNECLRDRARQAGQVWTEDLAPLCWCPEPRLVRPDDRRRLEPAYQDLRERFGIDVGPAGAA
jgi:glycosyltransferase involved in cell wall biosynthesis